MWRPIENYQHVTTLAKLSKARGFDRKNATRYWEQGRRDYLEPDETPMKLGRDWLIFRTED